MEDDKALVEEGEIHDDDNDSTKDDKEDIPDNFFDDFNNEGFMESLQIVDSLDDTNPIEDDDEIDNEDKSAFVEEKCQEKSNEKKKLKKSEVYTKSRSKERKYHKESPHKKRKSNESALRRDPNKTKRDLEKDREKFFKKKEQKVISKIVETGLVPPGMESEMNLSVIESEKNVQIEKRERGKSDSTKDRSKERKTSRERRSSISKERRRRRSRSRSYGRYSPRFRSRSRSRGKRRERSREKKSFERRLRSRSRGRIYEEELYSPPHNRKRQSRSVSDRERWLKERDRSPERKYQGIIREKKMSFLEEIKLKLNGELGCSSGGDTVTYPFPKNPVQLNFPSDIMYSDMAPVGSAIHPQYNQNYMISEHSSVNANYNEEFFIGTQSAPPMNIPQMMPVDHHKTVMDQSLIPIEPSAHLYSAVPVPPPNDTSEISAKVSELIARISASTKSSHNQSGKSPKAEKQWSLTDFLHVNPAPEYSSESDALKKKINVLSRCQDFLKEITGDKKINGKLKVTKNSHHLTRSEQNVSPLLRQKPFKFSFNTPLSDNSYQEILNRALIKTGVVSEVIDLVDEEDHDASINRATKRKVPFEGNPEPMKNMSMKMCQTDPVKCEDCEKRKAVQYCSIGIQCGESERYNVGVQVVEEDISNFKFPKNQSLAYMTPAQLLGRSDPVSSRAESFGNSSDRNLQAAYRDAPNWNRPRDYYDQPTRDYYGIPREVNRDPRFPRYL
ncbi:zinc finger CCCH domain-containing protein 13-like [Coccinella septempunctata]|uniref:zinc finger CCCH domain-containing protein 13-like n=1 Tax=Coccinella septempunctata TaxID=41139 RepID=UPI001D0704FE|nr:zinc finger CCCH domain-containing protein 13-like [Coccinella septempunctata]